jgi:hypothetical protein
MPGPAGMPAMPGAICLCSTAPNCGTGNLTTSTTVAELMSLYRMLYRQGKYEEAARVAQDVAVMNPIVGRVAIELVRRAKTTETGYCISLPSGGCAGCTSASPCGTSCSRSAKDCACGDGCKCCKGDKSDCACGKACKCKPSKPAAGACHGCLTIGLGACLPGMPCAVPAMARFVLYRQQAVCQPCPVQPCPVMTLMGALPPPPPCCCPVMNERNFDIMGMAARVSEQINSAACSRPAPSCFAPTCAICPASEARETRAVRWNDTPVCITASGNRIHITTPAVDAECDRVAGMAHGHALLLGNASVQFHTADRPACISADSISLGLSDGSYVIHCPAPGACKVKKPGMGSCTGAEDAAECEGHRD